MQSQMVRLHPRKRTAVHRAAFAVATLVVLLSACGSVNQASTTSAFHPPGPGLGSTRQSSPSTRAGEFGPIEAAWLSAQQAFDSAALTADPDEPGLAATTVPPQLTWTRSQLEQMRMAGEIAGGQIHFGPLSVVSASPIRAVVRACAHDQEIVESATTGQPAPGVLGQADFVLFESTMTLTGDEWKLETERVGVGQCHQL